MQPLEPELEALLLQIVPDLASSWGGVDDDEIDRVEQVAGRSLPACYRWFLGKFGRTMGPLSYRNLDFSTKAILRAYAEDRVERDPRYLLIAFSYDPAYPSHFFYDLDSPARDDALVLGGEYLDEDDLVPSFETLRELLGWGALFTHGICKHPQRCAGMFTSSGGDTLSQLEPVLHAHGFAAPIATGRHCGVFRGPTMDMISKSTPGKEPYLHAFDIGAADAMTIRSFLGQVASATSLELEILRWDPPLP